MSAFLSGKKIVHREVKVNIEFWTVFQRWETWLPNRRESPLFLFNLISLQAQSKISELESQLGAAPVEPVIDTSKVSELEANLNQRWLWF